MAPMKRASWLWLAVGGAAVCLAAALWFAFSKNDPESYESPLPAFQGKSTGLRETAIVPTLDTPAPARKSVIWCSSFQVAWNRLKTDLAIGQVLLRGAERVTERLNGAEQSEKDLAPDDYYAAAGFVKDGILEEIKVEMSQRFPKVPRPESAPGLAAVAYAYLKAGIRFEYPYFENRSSFIFTASNGKETDVRSFGFWEKHEYAYHQLRSQVAVLHASESQAEQHCIEMAEFVVDPCKHSSPHQLLLARVERKGSLAEMVAYVEALIKKPQRWGPNLGPRDRLLVPNMHWKVEHDFEELQGADKVFLNRALEGLYLARARQMIEFKLDKGGVELGSEAQIFVKPIPVCYQLNQPFLLLLKKRGAQHPFFVMWVDNSELLAKKD